MSILVCGDAIVGVVWALRYKNITINLKDDLKNQIFKEYETNQELQNVWNNIQADWNCCGVDGPYDYNESSWALQFLPLEPLYYVLPLSCCHPEEPTFGSPHNECITRMNEHVYSKGCYDDIYYWLQSSTDLLLVLGFCVITFIKLCFLFLLRSEIKEMIEKIKVIKGESETNGLGLPFQDLEAYLPRPSMQQDSLLNPSSTNATSQGTYRGNSITERCHCRLGVNTNLVNTMSGSRTILSISTANLTGGCHSKKHSLV
ncbi:hypothetical protein SSS_01726 [Sarcoptes scabiei]|nr:hypothetical protein SSS_01726 [Sarcoptes scabiei]